MKSNNKNNPYSNVLFGYTCVPAERFFGEDDSGFSVEVYADGQMLYKTYIFPEIEKERKEYLISPAAVFDIARILERHHKNIKSFKKSLNNGSCDGNGNYFIFSGTQYTTWNISHKNEMMTKIINPDYYKEYKPVIRQENQMLQIFDEIAAILKRHGICLSLDAITFKEKI